MRVPVVCSWCKPKRVFRYDEWPSVTRPGVTHGICPECQARMLREHGTETESTQRTVTVFRPPMRAGEPACQRNL